jgi:hypothetical protein
MKVHLSVSVKNLAESVVEYERLLGAPAVLVIPGEYALWRTSVLNFSIRQTDQNVGSVRHVGFERDDAENFVEYRDLNGLVWETFTQEQQAAEIRARWPQASYETTQLQPKP